MHTRTTLFRLLAAVAIGGLVMAPIQAGTAWAQTEGNATAATGGDPPARVGRLAQTNGTVSFHTADETAWSAATVNYPVTSGNSFWTEPNSTADIEISATRIALNQSTEFDIDTLDDQTLSASEPQGIVYVGVTALAQGENYQIQTPRGTVTISQPGRYAINAGDTDNPTTVTADMGTAQVEGPGVSITVGPQQTATITGTDTFQANVGAEQPDPQMDALLAPPAPAAVATAAPAAPAAPPPQVVAQMTGGADLSTVGTWAPTPQYGTVWYPPVQSGWVPYRQGHWGYVAPWGWTWIDNAPWGFAPFHYGRWAQIGGRWGWIPVTPGVTVAVGVPPVYAPALVAFAGFAAGVAVGLAVGGGPAVGWVPLGPREPYIPPYRVSNNYVRNVNVSNVTNVTTINNNTTINNTTINNYANARAATVVPAAAMTNSQPIATVARPVTPQQLAAARPVAAAPVRPTAATVGVTPAVARQLNIPRPAPGAVPARPAAPGPAVESRPPVAAARPGAATPVAAKAPLPALRPHTATTTVNAPAAGQAPRPGAPAAAQPARPGTPPTSATVRPPGAAAPGAPVTPEARPVTPAPGTTARPTPPAAAARPVTPEARPVTPAPGTVARPTPPAAAARPATPPSNAARPATPTVQHPTPAAPAARPVAPAPQTQRAPPPKPSTPAPQTMRAPPPRPAGPAVQAARPAPEKKCPEGKPSC